MEQAKQYPQPEYQQNKLIEIIKQTARNELYTSHLYWSLTLNKLTKKIPFLSGMANKAYKEDKLHFLTLTNHCHSLKAHMRQNEHNNTTLPVKSNMHVQNLQKQSISFLIEELKVAESQSIYFQQRICSMSLEHDYQTFDIVYSLLNENIEHENNLTSLLSEQIDKNI